MDVAQAADIQDTARSATSCTRSSRSSTRSAGASRARGSARRCAASASTVPLEIHEVPSGTQVFDWTIPREWNIADAYVKDADGRRVIDFADSNLHVVNYSAPVAARMTLEELRPRLTSIPEHPEWIPYRTSYYKEDWGFCLSHDTLARARGRRVRGLHRLDARRRLAELRRGVSRR